MSTWASVRGSIELTEEMVGEVYKILESSIGDAVRFGITASKAEFCNEWWIIPMEPRPWMHYAFYGGDVRIQAVPFIRHQMGLISEIRVVDEDGYVDFPKGVVHVDSSEESYEPSQVWELENGRLAVSPKPPAV